MDVMTSAHKAALLPPSDEQTRNLQAWRAQALELMPYMASMLFSLRPVNAPGLGTFAVDPTHRLYVDFDEVSKRGNRWCAEALLHECCHLFGQHAERAKAAAVQMSERMMWNCATDAEINDDLRDAGCKMEDAIVPGMIGQPDHETCEVYMAALRRQDQAQPNRQGQGSDGAQGKGQGGDGDLGQDQQQDGTGAAQQSKPFRGCGSGSGGVAAPCELDANDDLDGTAPGASAAERERTVLATAATIRDQSASGRGTVPAGLVERAEAIMAPSKLPWRQILSSAVKRAVAARNGDFDTTYSRRNRRRHSGRIIYPGTFSPQPTLAVVRDTSGSMSRDDLNQVTIEVDSIARKVGARGRDLRVLDVDADVHEVRDYKNADTIAEVTGRGGTDMRVGIEAALKLKPRPNAVVVISDGGTPWPEERVSTPVVACLVGQAAEGFAESVPDWIRTVVVEDVHQDGRP